MTQNLAIGIDFGNSRCCTAIYDYNCLRLIENPQTLPSNLLFGQRGDDEERIVVGITEMNLRYASNIFYDLKRIMCKEYKELEKLERYWSFQVTDHNGSPKIEIRRKMSTQILSCEPIALVSLIFEKLVTIIKTKAEFRSSENEKIDAVVTVPTHSNNAQRLAILHAAQIANINVLQLINETSAAAISYGFNKNFQIFKYQNKFFLIFDFGSGRLDASVIFVDLCLFKLLSNVGDSNVGGKDIDNIIMEYIIEKLQEQEPYNDCKDPSLKMKLLQLAEQAKITLTYEDETSINVTLDTSKDLKLVLSRDWLEFKAKHLFERAIQCISNAINNAKLGKDEINEVILLGGSSKIPVITKMIKEFFNNPKIPIINLPSHATAEGAAIYAASLMDPSKEIKVYLNETTAFAIGIETNQDDEYKYIFSRATPIPNSIEMNISNPRDSLNSVLCKLYEDEKMDFKQKNLLGKVVVTDPSRKNNQDFVKVCFEIDRNNILRVTETDQKNESTSSIILEHARACLDEQQLSNIKLFIERYRKEKKFKEYCSQLRPKIFELDINHIERGKVLALMSEINNLILKYEDFDRKFEELKDMVRLPTSQKSSTN